MSNIHSILRDSRLVEAGITKHLSYKDGESIIVEQSEEGGVYLIERGLVRVLERIELDDQRHIQPGICDLGAGEVFGELSLFDMGPRYASVVAVEPCDLLFFDAGALSGYFDQNPEFGYQALKELFNVLAERLRQADRRLCSLLAWGLKAHGIDSHL